MNNQVKAGSILDFLSTLTGAPTSEFPLDPAIEEEYKYYINEVCQRIKLVKPLKYCSLLSEGLGGEFRGI